MTIYFTALALLMTLFVYAMLRINSGPLSWRFLAWVATREKVFVWLLRRAFRTPYSHITSADGTDVYMKRYWLFNPYVDEQGDRKTGSDSAIYRSWLGEMLPSVRIHHIRRADQDRHLHSHPWNARTIILKGWYEEERYSDETAVGAAHRQIGYVNGKDTLRHVRIAGYTGRLLFGQYHRITAVPRDGVWTMFITWRKRGSWGFDVDGVKVPWREYLAQHGGNVTELPADPIQPSERGA